MRALRRLASHFAAFRFLQLAIPSPVLIILFRAIMHLPKRLCTMALGAWSYSFRYPHRYSKDGVARPPRFLGDPLLHLPCSLTPVEPIV